MGCCASCGVSIPDGQKFCSMCYGDPGYGRDGYYQQWLDEAAQKEAERRQEEERWLEELQRRQEEEQDNG